MGRLWVSIKINVQAAGCVWMSARTLYLKLKKKKHPLSRGNTAWNAGPVKWTALSGPSKLSQESAARPLLSGAFSAGIRIRNADVLIKAEDAVERARKSGRVIKTPLRHWMKDPQVCQLLQICKNRHFINLPSATQSVFAIVLTGSYFIVNILYKITQKHSSWPSAAPSGTGGPNRQDVLGPAEARTAVSRLSG